ncbi:MAG: hypothetical protein EP330_00855 [Deltaproteobacteria bacterium]|nr:MAG: hypothetical protein EP330_00855 [Deltaproteobacteria bacterium]
MKSVDARVSVHSHTAGVRAAPDTAVIPVQVSVHAPTAQGMPSILRALHRELEAATEVPVTPVSVEDSRQKLLKTGVFGQGVRVEARARFEVAIALPAGLDFWQRMERVAAVRARLDRLADGDARIQLGATTYTLRDRDAARASALGRLREELDAWTAATDTRLDSLELGEVRIRIDGPDQAWVEAAARVTLTDRR